MSNYVVGFTGTREGMSEAQRASAAEFMSNMVRESAEAEMGIEGLHGDCVGADADFHQICRDAGLHVSQRPCNLTSMRAYTDAAEIASIMAPMKRNQMIVDDCDVLVACPPPEAEVKRSGTWATIRMGRRDNKQVVIIYPDGSIVEDCSGEHQDGVEYD